MPESLIWLHVTPVATKATSRLHGSFIVSHEPGSHISQRDAHSTSPPSEDARFEASRTQPSNGYPVQPVGNRFP